MNARKRLLVTGGAGFIGANFCHHWMRAHPDARLVVLDALTYAGNRASLKELEPMPGFRFVHGDIRDGELVAALLREEKLDTIVHFAAESHVDRSILGPEAFIETNVLGTCRLMQAARRVWMEEKLCPDTHRFHHVSTDEVYGTLEPGDPPFREDTPYNPSSPYAASKAAADHFVRAWMRTFGLRASISNCSNNYGPWHFPEKLIPLALINLLQGKAIPVYGDGRQVRDWLHVADHCAAIDLILNSDCEGETYNIGGNCEVQNIDLVRSLCGAVDALFRTDAGLREQHASCPAARGESCEQLISFVRDRPGHDRRYGIDAGKLERELGFRPAMTLAAGLDGTIRWYLDHPGWWLPLLDGKYRDWIAAAYPARS